MAPIFRRACPDQLEGLVNLPTLFATNIVMLQCYSTLDVFYGVLTGRPMFFRYTVDFTPEVPESLFFLVDAPGLRWAFGLPDRLTMTFARMNGLLEVFGPHVPTQVVSELEAEIKRMKPIVDSSAEPHLFIRRTAVQQSWFLAALIYLYMVCDSISDIFRVVSRRCRVYVVVIRQTSEL